MPVFSTPSEHEVYETVVRQLPEATVLTNLRFTDAHKDHEIDLLVLIPDVGVVVVEVKGSTVWVEGEAWYIQRSAGPARIHPIDQARDAKYGLRHYAETDPRWSRSRVRWAHHVVLARTRLADDFATPDCPRWQISGENDLTDLGERLCKTVERVSARAPSRDEIGLICEILAGRSLPMRDVVALARDREDAAQRLTVEQASLLKVTRLLPRTEIRGGAGSGKTVLAIEQAKQMARGSHGTPQRVAVLCYSYGLASYLSRMLLVGSRKKQPAFVGTYEDLGRRWGLEITAGRDNHDYWERELPALMRDRAAALAENEKFDSIVVDEAQDFADDWWSPLLLALRDPVGGGFHIYSDERQRVFGRFGQPPVPLVPLVLDDNLRNTLQIARSFLPLAPTGMRARGGHGPDITYVACSTQDALSVADDQVEALFDEGWGTRDIALITTGSRHPVQAERQESLGQHGYWDSFWSDDDVFYGHVLGFKGLERRAVVLCVNEDGHRERGAERLYVGLSRATDRLIVVGDDASIVRMGGAAVLGELGVAR